MSETPAICVGVTYWGMVLTYHYFDIMTTRAFFL